MLLFQLILKAKRLILNRQEITVVITNGVPRDYSYKPMGYALILARRYGYNFRRMLKYINNTAKCSPLRLLFTVAAAVKYNLRGSESESVRRGI